MISSALYRSFTRWKSRGSGFSVRRNLSQNRRCQILETPTRSLPSLNPPSSQRPRTVHPKVAWDAGVQGAGSRTGLPQLALCCNLENIRGAPSKKKNNNISHQIPQKRPPIRNHGGCCKCWYSRTRAVLRILFDGK